EPAVAPARRQAPDEDAFVEEVRLHADAVAEDRPARERARGVDRDDADALSLRPEVGDETIDERRLAGAGGARDADDVGLAGARVDLAHDRRHAGGAALDGRDEAGERAPVAGAEALEKRRHLHARSPRSSAAATPERSAARVRSPAERIAGSAIPIASGATRSSASRPKRAANASAYAVAASSSAALRRRAPRRCWLRPRRQGRTAGSRGSRPPHGDRGS